MHGMVNKDRATTGTSSENSIPSGERGMQQFDLRATLGLLRRHKWTILLTVVCVVGATLLFASQLKQRFTATTLVVVDNRDAQLLGFQSDLGDGSAAVDTEVEIARSSTVLRRAADTLNLAASPDFAASASPLEMLKAFVGIGPPVAKPDPASLVFAKLSAGDQGKIIEKLSRSVDISRRGPTNVISISATL